MRHLLAPVEPEQFISEYWSRRSLHIAGAADKFEWLFDHDRFRTAAACAASSRSGQFQLAALVKSRSDEPLTLTFTDPIEPQQIDAVLARGDSVCATDIGTGDPRLSSYAAAIRRQLGFAGTARFNCYLSPAGDGADLHFDVRMATTLQIAGRKRWRFASAPSVPWPPSGAQLDAVGEPVWMHPWIPDQGWTTLRGPELFELEEVVLVPGDVLCVPAGCWHEACAMDEPSLALNLSFGPVRFADLMSGLLAQAFDAHPDWRGGPPPATWDMDASEIPDAIESYFAARLADVRSLFDGLDPAGPELSALWRRLIGA